jgi:XTP/dITP diphosphohydrolase
MPRVLIASNNQGKLKEIQALLKDLRAELLTPARLGLDTRVSEDGQTYAENAALKGKFYAQESGMITLADDSGLEVDVLNGLPGLYSARFDPQAGAIDADRRSYLLRCLLGKPRPWLARFRCVLALVTPDGESRFVEGICEGEVIPEERGTHGFGYDPIFLVPELGKTMAELTMLEKNRISHRARAVRAVLPILVDLLRESA